MRHSHGRQGIDMRKSKGHSLLKHTLTGTLLERKTHLHYKKEGSATNTNEISEISLIQPKAFKTGFTEKKGLRQKKKEKRKRKTG